MGMWQPSTAAQQYGNCQNRSMSIILFLNSSSDFGICLVTHSSHKFSTIAFVTLFTIVHTVETLSPVISKIV